MTIQEYQKRTWEIVRKIYNLERDIGYFQDKEAAELEIDTSDPSQCFDKTQATRVMRELEEIMGRIAYNMSPIQHTGKITLNDWKQYELDNIVLDCGTRFEVVLYDEDKERNEYVLTTIEHDGEDYYLTYNGSKDIEGLVARMR